MLSAPAAARYLAEGYLGRQRFRRAFMHVTTGMASKTMALKLAFIWETPRLRRYILLEKRLSVLKSRMEFSAL